MREKMYFCERIINSSFMKRFLLSLVVLMVSLSMQAQSVSYDNMMKLSKMKTVSKIKSALRSWGYKLGQKERIEDYDLYVWGFGTAEYDDDLEIWTSTRSNWAMLTYMKYDDGGGTLFFNYPSALTYSQLKSQLQANGRKVTEENTDEFGSNIEYEKAGTDNYVTLTELARKDGGF